MIEPKETEEGIGNLFGIDLEGLVSTYSSQRTVHDIDVSDSLYMRHNLSRANEREIIDFLKYQVNYMVGFTNYPELWYAGSNDIAPKLKVKRKGLWKVQLQLRQVADILFSDYFNEKLQNIYRIVGLKENEFSEATILLMNGLYQPLFGITTTPNSRTNSTFEKWSSNVWHMQRILEGMCDSYSKARSFEGENEIKHNSAMALAGRRNGNIWDNYDTI